MSDPVVLVLQEDEMPGHFADFAGNVLALSAETLRNMSDLPHPLVARVEIAAPEVEGEPG